MGTIVASITADISTIAIAANAIPTIMATRVPDKIGEGGG